MEDVQEKPKRIVTWLEQLEPESYERIGSPAIDDTLRSWPSGSPAPLLHSQEGVEKTNGPPGKAQQRLDQPYDIPHPSQISEPTNSRRIEDPSATRKYPECVISQPSSTDAGRNELCPMKSPARPAGK